jgi:EmrB/QacA subfamily drug resistance transporter
MSKISLPGIFNPWRRVPPYVALIPVCVGVFIAADDQTVVVTILPQIMLDMEVQVWELDRASWTITGYLLGYVAAMPLIGRISDVWGHRRIFVLSMLVFMVGSAAAALMPTLGWLVVARVFQAVGAGALVPVSIAIVGDLFPAGRRGLPMGLIGASAEAGGVIGPLWGGIITRYLDWEWVFWINLPLGAAVLVILALVLRPSPHYKARVDYLGGGLIAVSLAALTLGLARVGDADVLMVGYLVSSVLALALFIVRQGTVAEPLLPLSMFKGWAFRAANATHLLVGGALIIGMVTIPLMANTVLGQSPLEGGLRLMRLTAAIPVGAVLGGLACQRMDFRVPTIAGLALAALGFMLMSRWDLATGDPELTLHLATAGLGFGLVIAPIALAAMNSVGAGDRGTAAGVITAMRMVGMTLGLATLTAWGMDRFQGLVAGLGSPFRQAGETGAQFQERSLEYWTKVTDAGFTLYNEFFLVAMGVSMVAILTAALMAWSSSRRSP